jgi:hypothetical protein
MNATLTDIAKHNGSMTAVTKPKKGGYVFYGWLFLFTITEFQVALAGVSKHSGSLTSVSKH